MALAVASQVVGLGAAQAQAQSCTPASPSPSGQEQVEGNTCTVTAGGQAELRDVTIVIRGDGTETAALRASDRGSVIAANGLTITTNGANAFGAWALTGGRIDVDPTTIITSGSGAHGLFANGPGAIITTSGDSIYTGVRTNSAGVPIRSNGAVASGPEQYVSSGATGAHGAYALDGGQIWINVTSATGTPTGAGGLIRTLGTESDGIRSEGANSRITVANETIQIDGANSNGTHALGGGTITGSAVTINLGAASTTGARAETGGTVDLTGSTIQTTSTTAALSTGQSGLIVSGAGSRIGFANGSVTIGPAGTTVVNNLTGGRAEGGGSLVLTNAAISTRGGTTGTGNAGLIATGAGSTITASGGSVTTLSRSSTVIGALDGAVVTLSGVAVGTSASGVGQRGLLADNGRIDVTGGTVTMGVDTTTAAGNMIAVQAQNGGQINLTNTVVNTTGRINDSGNYGLSATGTGSRVTISGGSVTTISTAGIGARAENGGVITVGGTKVTTGGSTAHGLQATGANARITATDFVIAVAGQNAYGISALNGGVVALSGPASSIVAAGQGGSALRADGSGSLITADGTRLSALRNGGAGAQAFNTGTVRLTNAIIFSSGISGGNSAPGAQAGTNGTVIVSGGAIVTGATLGTDPTLPTYGLPVDASGNRVTDPTLYVPTGTTGANGIAIANTGGTVWLNVDPATGAATGSTTFIDTYGTSSSGIIVQQSATATSSVRAANTIIVTRGLNAMGLFVQGSAGAPAPTGQFANMRVFTFGQNGHAVLAQTGAFVTIRDSTLVTGAGSGIRSDQAGSVVIATNLLISGMGEGGTGLNATGGTIDATDVTILISGRGHGMTLSANAGTNGTLISRGGSITTGVLLGTDPALATFGKPVDASGALVTNPANYLPSGGTGHGIFTATGGSRIWVNVDPAMSTATGHASFIRTLGENSEGMDIQGADSHIWINNVTVSTAGNSSYGMRSAAGGNIHVSNSLIGTGGQYGYGLAAFEDGRVLGVSVSIATRGEEGYGLIAYDDASSVNVVQAQIATHGRNAHGAVAWDGGLVTVANSVLVADGPGAMGLHMIGDVAPSSAVFTDSRIVNADGPVIGIAGIADLSLTRTQVGRMPGDAAVADVPWLFVGNVDDFPELATPRDVTGPPIDGDAPQDPLPPEPDAQAPASIRALAGTAGEANISAYASTLTGSAITMPGSIANVTLGEHSSWYLTGSSHLTSLTNSLSSILFSAPAPGGPYKTLTVVNYIGANGILGLNTFLESDGSPSDRLVIDGGTATGTTLLQITNTGGMGARTQGDGILVVDATAGGTTAPDAFKLSGFVIAGPYEYRLYRGNFQGSADPDDWFLRNTLATPTPSPTPPPEVRREISVYSALPVIMDGRSIIGTLHDRVGEEELLRRNPPPGSARYTNGMWGRAIYHHVEYDGDPIGIYGRGAAYESDQWAGQLGFDLYRRTNSDGHRDHAGFYGAFSQIDARVDHNILDRRVPGGTIDMTSYTLGAYWTHFWPKGAYLDAVGQYTWHEVDMAAGRLSPAFTTGRSYAVSLEGGYPFDLGKVRVEPQAQLVYQNHAIRSFSDGAATIDYSDTDSLAGRIGLRVATTGPTTVWLRGNLWYEFLGQPATMVSSEDGDVPFRADLRRFVGQFGVGFTQPIDRRVVLYGSADYETSFDGKGSGYAARIGFRINW